MGILNEFERRLERAIEGVFAKAFRTGLQPAELASRILREMETGRTVGVQHVWVPNRYLFVLSVPDRERFQEAEGALARELEQVVREGARERGWSLMGPPKVEFDTDPQLRQGEYRCEAALMEGPQPREPTASGDSGRAEAAGEGELVLIENGRPKRHYPLEKELVVIGRLGESDIVLSDPGVSRRHAEVRREDGGFVIVDLGSTNGTMVNEATIGERRLEEGDRITLGRTVLEFRRR